MPLRRAILVVVLSLVSVAGVACDDGPTPPREKPGGEITDDERAVLAAKLRALMQRTASGGGTVETDIYAMAEFALMGLLSGAPVTALRASDGALHHVVAFEFEQTGSAPFKVVVAFRDTVQIAYAHYAGTGSAAFPPSTSGLVAGRLWRTPNLLWAATAGNVAVARATTGGSCDAYEGQPIDPATCHTATFDASLSVSASTPVPGGAATGSRTFSFPTSSVGGLHVVE